MAARNAAIFVALREVGAFADQPGTLGVTATFGATACELDLWHFVCLPDGSHRLAATFPQPLHPGYLEAARATRLPLDEIAAVLWASLSDAVAAHRGRVLVAWSTLAIDARRPGRGAGRRAAQLGALTVATKRTAKATTAKTPRKPSRARPTAYTDALFDDICAALAGGKSLVAACKPVAMPCRQTVHRWIAENPALEARYLAARDDQADYFAEQVVDIADEVSRKKHVSKEQIAAARLRMDARNWYAGKVRPKKWGDKIDVSVDAKVSPFESLSDDELNEEIAKADHALREMRVGIAIGAAAGVAAAMAGGGNAAG